MKAARDTTALAHTFIARHPIVDRDKRVWGYELLFRGHAAAAPANAHAPRATAKLIVDALFTIGLDTLVGDGKASIHIGREMLLEGLPSVLPSDRVVLAVGGDILADDDVIAACRELRQAGFSLAIDDFALDAASEPLVPLVSFLKMDVQLAASPAWRERLRAIAQPGGPLLMAKRVETPDQFAAGLDEPFNYFQGFFLGHPVTMPGRAIAGPDLGRLRLLQALQNPMLSLAQLEELVKPDAALCHQILRAVNSVAFAQRRSVDSIRQALLLLGRDAVRRWTSLWTLAGLGSKAHPELVKMSAVRARCCELLGEVAGGETLAAEAFLVGLCSLLDTILGSPMVEVIKDMPLSTDSRAALLGDPNRLRHLLDCTLSYERGQWTQCEAHATAAGIDVMQIPVAYLEGMTWRDRRFRA
jgi:EAL and modified HD-GYP domain-containing signal transduction protein